MAEEKVRKTTAKKTAVRRTTTKVAPRKTAVRKTVATAVRKAPARQTLGEPTRARRSPKTLIVALLVLAIAGGVSAGIGFTDKGQINVAEKIAQRKQNASPEEQAVLNSVPVQQAQNNIPNGGLVGTGKSAPVAQTQEPVATTTASTTAETASSTDTGAEGGEQAGNEEEPQAEEAVLQGEQGL